MEECADCKKEIGIFKSSSDCMEDGCKVVFCLDCEDKHTCEKCDNVYCMKHMQGHECESESTEEDEEESEDETMAESTYTVKVTYGISNEDEGTSESEKSFNNLSGKEAKEIITQIDTQLNSEAKYLKVELDETKERYYSAFVIEKAVFRGATCESDEDE